MHVKDLVNRMIEVYGVRSYLNNDDDEDIWFECPECGEPIYACDWDLNEYINLSDMTFECPVCEYILDI